jgi:hypothetical protein
MLVFQIKDVMLERDDVGMVPQLSLTLYKWTSKGSVDLEVTTTARVMVVV